MLKRQRDAIAWELAQHMDEWIKETEHQEGDEVWDDAEYFPDGVTDMVQDFYLYLGAKLGWTMTRRKEG
jgi:hypothetical protein